MGYWEGLVRQAVVALRVAQLQQHGGVSICVGEYDARVFLADGTAPISIATSSVAAGSQLSGISGMFPTNRVA